MPRSLKTVLVLSGSLLVGTWLGATSRVPPAHAGAAVQEPLDPKKKKAGEPCKSSDECQKHHRCVKVGDQSVCQAPPPPRLPPGAVT